MTVMKNEAGNRYGMLQIIRHAGSNKRGNALWECLCDCGKLHIASGHDIRHGGTRSCGCTLIKHGMYSHPIRAAFQAAKTRCTNNKCKSWKYYGGRGIEFRLGTVKEFLERMLPSWVDGASLDRINTDGHYEYGNLRWSTITEQNRNKRNNMVIEYRGRSMNLSSWAEEFGISPECISWRIRHGWTVERALTTPPKRILL